MKIAVLGSHPITVWMAPFGDPDWKIWACSPHNFEKRELPRVDEWFETHMPAFCAKTRQRPYLDYVRSLSPQIPVWMRDRSGHPCAREYPEKELKREFRPGWFTSSIAYIMAKAIVEKPEAIGLFGIMQASDNEYCAAPETRALTSDLKWVPVGDLKVGQELIAFDENPIGNSRRQWRRAVVDSAGFVKRPCYRIDMADGTRFVASFDHKWLNADSKWVETRWLRGGGDYPSASRLNKLVEPWRRDESWDAGYLAGGVDADGTLTQFHNGKDSYQFRVSFAQRDNAMRAAYLAAAKRLGFEFSNSGSDRLDYNLLGGKAKTLEFLGRVRPPRLLDRLDTRTLGEMRARSYVPVENVEPVGERDVVALSTSTGTFVAEGFASHNTYQRPGIQDFIWEAHDRGIDVVVPDASNLFAMPKDIW